MGKGNVCVFGKYEGLYFADKGYLEYYVSIDNNGAGLFLEEMGEEDFANYEYDWNASNDFYRDFIHEFTRLFSHKFKSFSKTNKNYGVILKSNLFEIEIEDNEWGYAVKLIQKQDSHLEGLQKKHYKSYLNGIKDILLEIFPSIGIYKGVWTNGRITRGIITREYA